MGVLEIICGVLMLITSVLIIITTMMQSRKQQDMTTAFSGTVANFYSKGGTTKEQSLAALTKVLAVVMFVLTLAANIIGVVVK